MQQNLYIALLSISAMFSAAAAVYAWGRRPAAGASYLAAIILSVTIWTVGYLMELANTEKEVICFWLKFEYLGIAFLPLFCMLFAFRYAGLDKCLTFGSIAAMSVVPVITLLLNWTNSWHGLYYSRIDLVYHDGLPMLAIEKGIWYWVHIVYTYLALFLMTWFLVRASWKRGVLFRKQISIIIISASLPWLVNILYMSGMSPLPNLDLSPFTFSFMGIVLIFGLFKFRIFNIMPIARDILIENMRDGVLVLNDHGVVVDINPAALRLTGLESTLPIGQDIEKILSPWPEFLSCCRDEKTVKRIIPGRKDSTQSLDMNVIRLADASGRPCGWLILLRDITAHKQLETEREDLIRSLREALDSVKTLKGLLPICASCKKIRDDGGYWHQVEVYIHEHTEVDFSHGLCPDCVKTLYSELNGNS